MMSSTSRTRYPFTTSQWQELEHQALIFKYMISGMPIPPHLLCIIRRSFDSSLLHHHHHHHHQPPQMGWSYYQMGSGKKVDPEPGRCRRTDGKKWRCSKEAYPDSKYCERHMHRGRNRSRKPVELITTTSSSTISSPKTMSVSSFSINSNSSPTISPSSSSSTHHHSLYNSLKSLPSESHQFTTSATLHHPFLYPLSSHENASSTTNNLWDSPSFSHISKGYSHEREGKEEVNELPFFSETCGTLRIRSSDISNNLSQRHSCLKIQSQDENSSGEKHVFLDYLGLDSDVKDDKPRKVMHHFFDEWPLKEKDSSWFDSNEDKLSRHASSSSSEIQLSISMPNSSSDNLFFARKNEK